MYIYIYIYYSGTWIIDIHIFYIYRCNEELPVEILHPHSNRFSLQVVTNQSVYAYTAYIDDRKAQDVDKLTSTKSYLRIFFYYSIHLKVEHIFHCLVWCKESDNPKSMPIYTVRDLEPFWKPHLRYGCCCSYMESYKRSYEIRFTN